MAYIGKQPSTKFSAAAKLDSFTGDGSTTTFDLTNVVPAGGENGLQVFVDNVRQKPGSANAYSLGNDGNGDLKRITFTAAPDSGAEIYVITTFEATNIKNVGDGTITEAKIATSAVTSAKISDGTIVNADINACAAISDTKLGTISTACKVATSAISQPGSSSVYLAGDGSWGAIDTSQQDTNSFNISLLGFKMAVNEGLTVFNLVDGVVDEFNDESGTDEAEGSNDTYCASSDFYQNLGPSGSPVAISAGFTTTSITEPDTSTTGTNPSYGSGTMAQFTVPSGLNSVSAKVWGAGGAGGSNQGGGGGFVSGCLATTPGQTLYVLAGEGAATAPQNPSTSNEQRAMFFGGVGANFNAPNPYSPLYGAGGGIAAISNFDMAPIAETAVSGTCLPSNAQLTSPTLAPTYAPQLFLVAGAGGGAPLQAPQPYTNSGGAGGGLIGNYGGGQAEQTTANTTWHGGGGGSQSQGGQGFSNPGEETSGRTTPGGFLYGGVNIATSGEPAAQQDINIGSGGGAGYYGGGGGAKTAPGGPGDPHGHGGGGSSYYGHPQITSGATEDGGDNVGGGTTDPAYIACTNEGGEDGYVLLVGTAEPQITTSTTIVSTAFTSTSVPTSARIVVFEENVDTPTLNTDIVASISRDGGTTFTNATLSDSGYVTGSSGQRILTGQATISGQPSGQSMRWKLALANNTVKIHGVSLQWA